MDDEIYVIRSSTLSKEEYLKNERKKDNKPTLYN